MLRCVRRLLALLHVCFAFIRFPPCFPPFFACCSCLSRFLGCLFPFCFHFHFPECSPSLQNNPSSNPYGLGEGVKYYMLQVEDWTQQQQATSGTGSGSARRKKHTASGSGGATSDFAGGESGSAGAFTAPDASAPSASVDVRRGRAAVPGACCLPLFAQFPPLN